MITGQVNANREAIIPLTVHGTQSQTRDIEVIIDTGFDGFLTLPPSLIDTFALPWRRRGRAVLADGSESLFDVYEATVMWDGNLRRVTVDSVDVAPLIGMALLDGYEMTIQAVRGGNVVITVLP
ncbi:MAG: clan AA aspartic protease [Deltaproteobacteria bacterium]|nr:clan AA aspartic protease [Deltaproteobacteria bacterium]